MSGLARDPHYAGSAGDLLIQVRAMLHANAATGNLSILLPMVTSIDEVDEARRLIERAGREVEEMIGYAIPKPRIGIMLEVPSMVFMLPHLANRIDFISVGTNDLTQYILAVDRNNTRVASIYDSLHPAMLRALSMIAQEAEKMASIFACAARWRAIRCAWRFLSVWDIAIFR